MKRSSVQFYLKQCHITTILDDKTPQRTCTSRDTQKEKLRDFVETLDQKTDVTKLWSTIKGIDDRAKREADNEAITFNGRSFSSSKQLAARFNQQFNTSKLGRHTSSSDTRFVTRETNGNRWRWHRHSPRI